MSFEINWDKLPSSGKKKSSGGTGKDGKKYRPLNFVKFTDGSVHTLRPVGKGYVYWRFYYKAAKKYIIAKVVVDDDGKIVESNLDELRELLGCDPEQRFAINAIDRDDKVIKILNGPMGIAMDFAEIAQETGNKPGSSKGGDWKIKSTGDGKNRRYKTRWLGQTEFTEEELLRIKNPDPTKNEWYVLEEIFRPTSMEYIQKLMNPTAQTTQAPAPASAPSPAPAAAVAAKADDDDIDF